METVKLKLPAHDCTQGPLCERMTAHLASCDVIAELAADPMNNYAGFVPDLPDPDPDECDHYSCLVQIHEDCMRCMIEADLHETGRFV